VISKFSINMNTDELRSSSSSIDKKHTEKIKSPARLHLSLAHKRDTNKKTKTPPDLEREVANLKKKKLPLQQGWTLWVRMAGDLYDPIPVEIDNAMTIHEFKKLLREFDELDLGACRLYLMKLYSHNDQPLNPRSTVHESLNDNDEIQIAVGVPPAVKFAMLVGLQSPSPGAQTSPCTSPRWRKNSLSLNLQALQDPNGPKV